MIRKLSAVVALCALPAFVFAAEPAMMSDTDLDQVVAGGDYCPPPPPTNCKYGCGNNGWGNGFDGSNAGSDNGGSAPSKTANGTNGGGINTNPTTSSGR